MQQQPARVLHVAQAVAGGIASFLEEVAAHQNAAYGAGNVRFALPTGVEAHLPQLDPLQIIPCGSTSRNALALAAFARAVARIVAEFKPDIVHVHSTFAGVIVRAMLAFRRERPRIIYCPHGWSFGMETPALKKRLYAAVEQLLARKTDMILVVSQDEHRLAMKFGMPPGKTRVVPNGIAWAPAEQRSPREGPVKVGFIGRHDRQKGLDILLDTIERFPSAHLQFEIVGDAVLQRRAGGSVAAPSNITFHGWLSRARTLELLRDVDVLVMPSRWDAAPIVAIEAMRAGVPVIASDRGGLPEIVQDGVGGYVFELDDPGALGRIFATLERDRLELLGVTARARWESEYVSDKMNELTCAAYDDVLAMGRKRTCKSAAPGSALPTADGALSG